MRPILIATLAALASPALAAPPSAASAPIFPLPPARAYDPAPWWMDKPVIPAIGYVTTEVPANRANLSATYDAVDRDVADATKAAAAKAKAISGALQAFGVDKVRVETRFTVTPLYEQYREKSGQVVDNQRADKIDRYQVSVQFAVEVRDVRLVEPVYAILMSAKPSQSGSPSFRLEVSDEVRTEMFKLAVEDAHKRAEQAAT
ncbi:MAG TPA: SIMPL domain-containing protein, partial [Phenylobacterium sp.]|nr:SIMPL domain-containing protein [Phenylobacterium sp.]